MSQYNPHTLDETQTMLSSLGLTSLDELFRDIPDSVRHGVPADEHPGLSQMEIQRAMEDMAARNTRYDLTLRGAGCYDHFIPPIVEQLANKKEFLSAYTPYQAELSQGVLQTIFEYQTLICELTGMDASNAGVYDFATAAAESAVMCRERKRVVALVSEAAHPDTLAVMRTYGYGTDTDVRIVPLKDGRTDSDALKKHAGGRRGEPLYPAAQLLRAAGGRSRTVPSRKGRGCEVRTRRESDDAGTAAKRRGTRRGYRLRRRAALRASDELRRAACGLYGLHAGAYAQAAGAHRRAGPQTRRGSVPSCSPCRRANSTSGARGQLPTSVQTTRIVR